MKNNFTDSVKNKCVVCPIKIISDHPISEILQIAEVCGNQVVVGKHYDDGVLGVYFPVGSIIPYNLLEDMRLYNFAFNKGRLGGKYGDKVKIRELLGVQSNGLFYGSRFYDLVNEQKVYAIGAAWDFNWSEGQDVTDILGITFE